MNLLLLYVVFHLICAMFVLLLYHTSSTLLHLEDYEDFKGSLLLSLLGGPVTLTVFIIGVFSQ